MLQNNSIFKRLLFNNLVTVIVLILVAMLVVYCLIYAGIRRENVTNIQVQVDKYVHDIGAAKNEALAKSDYIVSNIEILQSLDTNTDDNRVLLELSNRIHSYFDAINNSAFDTLMIYVANNSIFQNRYVSHMSRFEDMQNVLDEFRREKVNMFWQQELRYDEGGAYFTYYRSIDVSDVNILRVKAYIPSVEKDSQMIFIVPMKAEYTNTRKYVSASVNDVYVAVCEIPDNALGGQKISLILLFVLVTTFVCCLVVATVLKTHAKTTMEINTFIKNLSENDIMNNSNAILQAPDEYAELKVIKNTLHTLVAHVQNISREKYQNELDKRRIALQLLQSKINPHVLYNSLTVISLNAFEKNDRDTMGIIDRLVGYYRLILANGKEFVRVSEEISMIEKYVWINEFSNKKSIHFLVNVSEEIASFSILHLLLQPFIENSILHGLAGKQNDCTIEITGIHEGNYLIFKIADNGFGMDKEFLDKLNGDITTTKGYGIKNTYERMKLTYGEYCSLSFVSVKNEFTTVTIKVLDSPNEKMALDGTIN